MLIVDELGLAVVIVGATLGVLVAVGSGLTDVSDVEVDDVDGTVGGDGDEVVAFDVSDVLTDGSVEVFACGEEVVTFGAVVIGSGEAVVVGSGEAVVVFGVVVVGSRYEQEDLVKL